MKESSKKILFALFDLENQEGHWGYTYDFLYTLFSEKSRGGIRSQVKLLFDQGFIQKTEQNKVLYFSLSTVGVGVVRQKYPLLRLKKTVKSKSYYLLILGHSGKNDVGFQKLSRSLKAEKAMKINRGIYLFSKLPNDMFIDTLLLEYPKQVLFLEVTDTLLGNIELFTNTELFALKNTLSGLSTQAKSLIGVYSDKKRLNEKDKDRFTSLFIQSENIFAEYSVIMTTFGEEVATFYAAFSSLKRVFQDKI